ncbi:MAG: DUF1062 domain-containing protein [Provencibacterium sp.]|nr:DUF1062 domain-containing protein [Provencibacterium sp.]
MKQVTWKLRCLSLPAVERYCKRCGTRTVFTCSGQFRVNAQKKLLDIWLIYQCARCGTTWNAEILSRVSSRTLAAGQLEDFCCNSSVLAWRYAADWKLLRRLGAEPFLPEYVVEGEDFRPDEEVELEIKTDVPLPVRVSALLRNKLGLPQKAFLELAALDRVVSIPRQDLKKCRLGGGIRILFQTEPGDPAVIE